MYNGRVSTIELTGSGLTGADVVAVARDGEAVTMGAAARRAMAESAAVVDRLAASDEPTYGVSTGFGSLATTPIPLERREELQRSLLRSHAAGMGPPVEREVVRAMLLLRARTLAMGYSGARPAVAETMVGLLNAGLTPVVPEHGSSANALRSRTRYTGARASNFRGEGIAMGRRTESPASTSRSCAPRPRSRTTPRAPAPRSASGPTSG